MKKISSSGVNGIIFKFFLKVLLLTALTVAGTSLFFAVIVYKLDLDLKYLEYFSFAAAAISAAVTSYFSVSTFKNNGFVTGILSSLPLIIYSFINLIVNGSNIIYFLIKLALILICAGLCGFLSTKKSKKFKVK